jgi:plastocyanin
MRQRFLVPVLLLVGVLALAGCGGSKSSSSTASTPSVASTPSGTTGTSGGAVAVTMQNIAFSPATIHVKVGQKITWTNRDGVDHNVTSQSGEHIASQSFGQGGTFSFTPTSAGTIKYVCTIHPGMNGTIVVTK